MNFTVGALAALPLLLAGPCDKGGGRAYDKPPPIEARDVHCQQVIGDLIDQAATLGYRVDCTPDREQPMTSTGRRSAGAIYLDERLILIWVVDVPDEALRAIASHELEHAECGCSLGEVPL